jgi:toxin ParE1/3/4
MQVVEFCRADYIVFYRDTPDHVEVWRVLHGQRDIPQGLLDAE